MAKYHLDDPKSDQQHEQNGDESSFWYFAIGAMMNPISMKNRYIIPIESCPGELLDYKLHFFGPLGLAEAVPSTGDSFHGVLHRVNQETMSRLDKIEIEYTRQMGKVRLYNGDIVEATVYTRPNTMALERGPHVDKPPGERYLEIMSYGAEHFGVKKSHVDFLRNHESQPRPQPHEFRSFGNPPHITMSLDDILIANGINENQPLRFTVNGKVVEVQVERDCKDWKDFSGFIEGYSHHLELFISKAVYDPKYGMPECLQDFSREHSAYIEDQILRFVDSRGILDHWKTVACFDQQYKD